MNIEAIWKQILKNEGVQYLTKKGLPFTYRIEGDFVIPDRTNYPLAKAEFAKALKFMPLDGPGKISNIVRGSAYVWAILSNNR